MNMKDFATRLNELAREEKFAISKLQEIRESHFRNIFTNQSIFDEYMFHVGGRNEFQFNVGLDNVDGKNVIRYGLAFSLEKGRNLEYPIEILSPRIEIYNSFIVEHNSDFLDLKMWYHPVSRDERVSVESKLIGCIPQNWIALDHFLFIGKYFEKSLSEITDDDCIEVLSLFDRLLPIYQHVESEAMNVPIVLNKISKLCWNDKHWTAPSGSNGKSRDKDSHEYNNKYGHEEWLFDLDKLIDGYHYAFIQPVNKFRSKYEGETFNILFYSVNSNTRKSYWVAEIKNVYVIDRAEERTAYTEYIEKDWLTEMYEQLEDAGAEVDSFKKDEKEALFNIRFKPEDVIWFDTDPVPFKSGERITHTRYTLLDRTQRVAVRAAKVSAVEFGSEQPEGTTPVEYESPAKTVQYTRLHKKIQNSMKEWLIDHYPDAKRIGTECIIGQSRVDLVMERSDDSLVFYEVKTYRDAKYSIREAIGQLLEYAHFPECNLATEFVIVSHAPLTQDLENYLNHLKKMYRIPLKYLQFDHIDKMVINETR